MKTQHITSPKSETGRSEAVDATDATDNWESTSIEAPRQKAGDAIERESHAAEAREGGSDRDDGDDDARMAAEAETLAERQATTDGGSVESD